MKRLDAVIQAHRAQDTEKAEAMVPVNMGDENGLYLYK